MLTQCLRCSTICHAQHSEADQVLCLAGATTPGLPSAVNASGCLYTTYMEHYGSSAQPAVTNMETVVIVASFDTNVSSLLPAAVQLQLDNGQSGTVSDVQAFPGQPNVFLIEVCHSRNSVYLLLLGPSKASLAVANIFGIQCNACTEWLQVQHPVSYNGRVTVSLPADAVKPLTYNVVSRPLVVQNLGFDVCST